MLVKTHNNKFAALVIAVILVLGLTLPACAAAVPEPELSFEATKYKNAEHGFSVYHPAAWEGTEEPELGPTVVYAAGDPGEPPLPAMVIDVLEGDTFADTLTAALEGGGAENVKIFTETETTLRDGTPAIEAEGAFSNPAVPLPLDAFWLGAKKDGTWTFVTVITIDAIAPFDAELFSEIAHTLLLE
ncbi:MAG: hypothetical protein ISS52_00050 [Dehalococcoidia bacterium]|nr:hypothetical protein [Dehalococcoidia bacterium]